MTNRRHLNDPETYAIIGAAMAVHTELGCGFLEPVYKASLALELRRRAVPFEREVALPMLYKGEPLPLSYRVDFICAGAVVVEVKARDALTAVDLAQAINCLRVARLDRGLLLNFGGRSLEHRRVVWGRNGSGSGHGGVPSLAVRRAASARDGEPDGTVAEGKPERRASRSLRWTPWRSSRSGAHREA